MYKVGDKVETPYGIGRITYISEYITQKGFHIQLKNSNVEFTANHLAPYKTAHEKLLDMGFKVVEDNEAWIVYEYKEAEYVIRFCKGSKQVGIYHDYENNANYRYFGLKLSRILIQYLEELSE